MTSQTNNQAADGSEDAHPSGRTPCHTLNYLDIPKCKVGDRVVNTRLVANLALPRFCSGTVTHAVEIGGNLFYNIQLDKGLGVVLQAYYTGWRPAT